MNLVMTPSLESVEDAIIAALKADTTIAAYARDIRSFQGTLEQAIAEGSFRDPAFLVIFVGGTYEPQGPLEFRAELEFQILVRATNLRGNTYQRKPTASGEVGTYQMAQDAVRVLALNDLGLSGLEVLIPDGVELLKTGENRSRAVSAYIAAFSTAATLAEAAPEDSLDEVVTQYETPNTAGTWSTVAEEEVNANP